MEGIADRFMQKVDRTGSCWIWKGAMGTANKRPMIRVGKRNLYASRVAFSLFKGELKKGLYVCHTCDNVSCVNPDHLWLGTPKQNKVDSVKKGRSVGKDNWFRTR